MRRRDVARHADAAALRAALGRFPTARKTKHDNRPGDGSGSISRRNRVPARFGYNNDITTRAVHSPLTFFFYGSAVWATTTTSDERRRRLINRTVGVRRRDSLGSTGVRRRRFPAADVDDEQ